MNEDHEPLKRMQTEYGAVIQCRSGPTDNPDWIGWNGSNFPNCYTYRICPKWLEERLKETQPEEEHEFKMGQEYWIFSSYAQVFAYTWRDDEIDNARYAMGNAFHTKEEAQVARDRQLARVKAERERTSEPEEIWVNKLVGFSYIHHREDAAINSASEGPEKYEYIAKRFVEADDEHV